MKLTTTTHWFGGLMKLGLAACIGLCAAQASVIYTFSATTTSTMGSPSHSEIFQLELGDFLQVIEGGPVMSFSKWDLGVTSCVACTEDAPAFHFLRASDSDWIQFADADGTTRLYVFPQSSLSVVGSYDTLAGINVNQGHLTVTSTPEPSTFAFFLIGAAGALSFVAAGRKAKGRG